MSLSGAPRTQNAGSNLRWLNQIRKNLSPQWQNFGKEICFSYQERKRAAIERGGGLPRKCCVLDTVCLNDARYRKRLPLSVCLHSFASSKMPVVSKSKCKASCYKTSVLIWVDGLMNDLRFYVLLTLL